MSYVVKVDIRKLIERGDFKTLKVILHDQEPAEVVEMIKDLPPRDKVVVFRLLPKDLAADVFSELEPDEQERLLMLFKDEMIKEILDSMDPDDRTELFEEMPANVVKKLLSLLSPEERELTMELLNYPPNSAGRMMNPHFIDLYEDMTVSEALVRVREKGKDVEDERFYTPFVIDRKRKLLGVVELKDLILADSSTRVRDLMNPNPIYVYTTTDREEVAQIVKKYDLIAVPVVDSEGRLVGVITVDDIIDVIEEEATEDIHHMASMGTVRTSYFHTPITTFLKSRLPWLALLLLMESLTANVVSRYEALLASIPIIAAFFTTMSGTGGNVGSQSAAIVIRSMALGEIEKKDWYKVLLRESLTAILLAIPLGVLLFFRAFLVSGNFSINFAVTVALFVLVVYSNLLGAMLPFLGVLFKIDPAVMAGPLLTTIVDITGIALYFWIIEIFLR